MTPFPMVLAVRVVPIALVTPPVAAAEGWESLFAVNWGLSFWTLATFLAMLAILRRFAWKPLLGALGAREMGIQGTIDEANRQREEAERLLADNREQLAEGRRRVQAMIAEGREAAERLRKDLEAKTRQESQAILVNARREIQRERDAALEIVRRESVELALAAASRLLEERLDNDRDRQLVMGYVDELSRAEGLSGGGGLRA